MSSVERAWLPRLSSLGLRRLRRLRAHRLVSGEGCLSARPKEAIGLDGALQKVIQASYGTVLLAIVAVGLLCYALFCFAEARYRRV